MFDLNTAKVPSPYLTITVKSLILNQISIQLFQLTGGRQAPRLLVLWHPVRARPHELHGGTGRRDTLHRECTHGTVEGENVQVSLAGQHQVPPHCVHNGSICVDSQRYFCWRYTFI